MIDNNEIQMPDEKEIDRSMKLILDEGLSERLSFFEQLKRAASLPFGILFFGAGDSILLSLIIYFGIIFFCADYLLHVKVLVPCVFLTSPMLFLLLVSITGWKEYHSKTMEMKDVCRINFRTLSVIRMAMFAAAAIVLGVPSNAVFWMFTEKDISFLWILSFSFSGLLLYAFISLAALSSKSVMRILIPPAVWIALSILLFKSEKIMSFVKGLPIVLFFILTAALAAGIFLQIKKYVSVPSEGEFNHAYS